MDIGTDGKLLIFLLFKVKGQRSRSNRGKTVLFNHSFLWEASLGQVGSGWGQAGYYWQLANVNWQVAKSHRTT